MNSSTLSRGGINRVWPELLLLAQSEGDLSAPRNIACQELFGVSSAIDMAKPLLTIKNRKLSYKFAATEALWILTGDNRLAPLLKVAPNYARFSDDGFYLDGAYGPMVTSQLRYVTDTLRKDISSRQAVMSIWRPNPRPSNDIPCTLSLQFLLRHNKINCIATMRSSDLWLGYPYDIFSFTMITALVSLRLPVPQQLGLLQLNAGSQHLYETDLRKAATCGLGAHCDEIKDMSLYGLNTPDDLLNCLKTISECPKDKDLTPLVLREINSPFFIDMWRLSCAQQ